MEKKHACLHAYDISTKAFSDGVKKAAALENISQEMNVAGWYITHHNAALGTKTRLTCFALIGCTLFNWVTCIADRRRQLSCVGEGVYSDATQLNPTSSGVELRRYKRAFSHDADFYVRHRITAKLLCTGKRYGNFVSRVRCHVHGPSDTFVDCV